MWRDESHGGMRFFSVGIVTAFFTVAGAASDPGCPSCIPCFLLLFFYRCVGIRI